MCEPELLFFFLYMANANTWLFIAINDMAYIVDWTYATKLQQNKLCLQNLNNPILNFICHYMQ